MDHSNVQVASQYVNNLLLARGLLRDGEALDFAAPAKGGHDETMANVINLVHDLVLRRDRENDHLSSLSQSIQALRTSSTQQAQAISKLENEKADLQRELSASTSQARSAKLDAKALDSKNKAYKEDIQRLRTSVGQIRAQCANDVRKRDLEIARLKKHIDVQRTRESRSGSTGPGGVTIIDPTTGKAHHPTSVPRDEARTPSGSRLSLHDDSNAHLTALSAELSETNEQLMSLVQSTIMTLKSLQGVPVEANKGTDVAAQAPQPNPSESSALAVSSHEPVIHVAETPSVPQLTDELSASLSSLQSLLTEPSFVPVQEVEIRDAELSRLQAGWETMEAQWREAVSLMNGWRQRMLRGDVTGAAISMDDIRRGMELAEEGLSVAGSPQQRRHRGRKRDSSGSEVSRASIDTYNDGVSELDETSMLSTESTGLVHEPSLETQDVEETPRVKKLRFESVSKQDRKGTGLLPAPQALRPKSGNSRSPTRKRAEDLMPVEPSVESTPTPAARAEASVPATARSDLMSPDIWMQPDSGPSQQEKQPPHPSGAADAQAEGLQHPGKGDAVEQMAKPVKRTVVPRRVASKRRSSLTPQEMRDLVGAGR